jgi:hypothetical protein
MYVLKRNANNSRKK